MQNMLLRNAGYFFIWADFTRWCSVSILYLLVRSILASMCKNIFKLLEFFWIGSPRGTRLLCTVCLFLQVASCLGFSVSIHDFDTDRVVACKKIQLAGGID